MAYFRNLSQTSVNGWDLGFLDLPRFGLKTGYGRHPIYIILKKVADTLFYSHEALGRVSNIFDTSHYITKAIQLALDKYNLLEQHLDSAKAKMDAKTLELYESIKGKVNEIKQPIK